MLIVLKRILGALPLTILNHISSLTEVPHSKIKTILLEKQNLLGIAFLRKKQPQWFLVHSDIEDDKKPPRIKVSGVKLSLSHSSQYHWYFASQRVGAPCSFNSFESLYKYKKAWVRKKTWCCSLITHYHFTTCSVRYSLIDNCWNLGETLWNIGKQRSLLPWKVEGKFGRRKSPGITRCTTPPQITPVMKNPCLVSSPPSCIQ